MIYIFSFLLMAAVLGYVALPLFRRSREVMETDEDEIAQLEARKTATYTAIKELQFEYELGNLSAADHHDLEEKYKSKAAEILKELDQAPGGAPVDEVEQQIQRRRKGGIRLEDEIERQVARRRGKAVAAEGSRQPCPRCGKPQKVEAKFCASCGAALKAACPACGAAYSPQDRFCSRCGGVLRKDARPKNAPGPGKDIVEE